LNARTNVNEVSIPSIVLTPDTDWRNIQVWDRKNISIVSAYDWLHLQYQGVIQNRKITINGNGISAEMTISEKYIKTQNILDGILSLIDKKIEKIQK
jgi:hypothetical protein